MSWTSPERHSEGGRFYFILIFWLCRAVCGILVFQVGIKPVPLEWRLRVLTTGLLGKSQEGEILGTVGQ